MSGARQMGAFFIADPDNGWHPRGPDGEDWPKEELGWCVFESVDDGGGERYYDQKHSVQCKTVAEAEDLLAAVQFIVKEMKNEQKANHED